jgi:hypothetical protein
MGGENLGHGLHRHGFGKVAWNEAFGVGNIASTFLSLVLLVFIHIHDTESHLHLLCPLLPMVLFSRYCLLVPRRVLSIAATVAYRSLVDFGKTLGWFFWSETLL